jgi:hypothetical protein
LYARLRHRISDNIESNNPNKIHQLFAELPRKLSRCSQSSLPLIVTTNYDNLLEQAFDRANQPYDIVYYVADGIADGERGRYKHKRYGEQEARVIEDPKKYLDLPLPSPVRSSSQSHPIILKLYGTWEDQFVITQDHLNLFASNWIDNLPTALLRILNQASVLFLGYNPSDSELQLIVNQFWSKPSGTETERLPRNSCLVHQSNPGDLEHKVWQDRRGVELIFFDSFLSLEDFATSFESEIEKEIERW